MSLRFLVINGPNLNMLGTREPEIYGRLTLQELNDRLISFAAKMGAELDFFQSNHEGELIETIQKCNNSDIQGIILNAGGYTHTSVALRDAIAAITVPVIEVHLTNPFSREDFRHNSYLSGVCKGVICGFGAVSYELALRALMKIK